MHTVVLDHETDFEGWRTHARRLLVNGAGPHEIVWSVGLAGDLFAEEVGAEASPDSPTVSVPRGFVDLARTIILHRDPARFALLYRLLWRLRDEPRLLEVAYDRHVSAAAGMVKAVRRDIHKMRAFVRFRKALDGAEPWFVAWFEPDHHIVEANAPFFMRRFAAMRWSILTPEASAHWDGADLTFGPGAARADAPADDAMEDIWRGYYASIFNPARLKVSAMRSEMPVKYWRNLPEAKLIAPLIASAVRREDAMIAEGPTEPNAKPQKAEQVPAPAQPHAGTLEALRAEAAHCRACPLWRPATQTVFGEGDAHAPVMFVGEQPGDQEDLEGRPFVGPAGQMFDRALAEAGVDRARTYVTNAVKHFKFEARGRRRIHQKPTTAEIRACRPWLGREMDLVRPRLIVALGATAAQSIFGKAMPIGKNRGRILDLEDGAKALVTVHPSYLLRLPDADARAREYAAFVRDLRLIKGQGAADRAA